MTNQTLARLDDFHSEVFKELRQCFQDFHYIQRLTAFGYAGNAKERVTNRLAQLEEMWKDIYELARTEANDSRDIAEAAATGAGKTDLRADEGRDRPSGGV